MSKLEEREKLHQNILSLKGELDKSDLQAIEDIEKIEKHLDEIYDVYIQMKQFVSRYDVGDWNSWGPPLWLDIERNEAALKRKLERLERSKSQRRRTFDRSITVVSIIFMVVAAIAAAFSAYFAYRSFDHAFGKAMQKLQETEKTQERAESENQMPPTTPLNKDAR